MTIINGLIALDEAKRSIFNSTTSTAHDADLESYISAATPVIEQMTGPMVRRPETVTFDGGRTALVLPWAFHSVAEVLEDDVAITDFTASPTAGIIYAGEQSALRSFAAGDRNITVTVLVGQTDIPENIKLATRELVRFWWQQGRQGNRPSFGNEPDTAPDVPSGFAVPRRVTELCSPNRRVDGFA
jgi:hypothetical protein